MAPKLHPGTDGKVINTEASGNHWYEKAGKQQLILFA